MGSEKVSGDQLLNLLGLESTTLLVQSTLHSLARGMQPELELDNPESLVDWVTVNEIGLEFGFEDDAYVRAQDFEKRRQGALLLTQLYFYGDTLNTKPFPYPLPFGLTFSDDRNDVHSKLSKFDEKRRTYIRDAWQLPDFNMTIAYQSDSGKLESVLCYKPPIPWPLSKNEREMLAPFTPDALVSLFGLRWSTRELRTHLESLDYASALPNVRSEHSADLRMTHGVEFSFAPGVQVPVSDPQFPNSLSLASVTYYGPRVYDAREWVGPMPLNLSFNDSQSQIEAKLGRKPDERGDFDRVGFAIWHLDSFSLRAEYSNIENHLLRATIMAPGFWALSGADKTDEP